MKDLFSSVITRSPSTLTYPPCRTHDVLYLVYFTYFSRTNFIDFPAFNGCCPSWKSFRYIFRKQLPTDNSVDDGPIDRDVRIVERSGEGVGGWGLTVAETSVGL